MSLALVALVAASPAAALPPVLLAPDAGATLRTSRPSIRWRNRVDYTWLSAEFATSRAEKPNDLFRDVQVRSTVADAATTYTVPAGRRLWAGRWFWHIVGNVGNTRVDSVTRSFTIPVVVHRPRITGRVGAYGVTSGLIAINSNSRAVRVRVQGSIAGRACVDQAVAGQQLRSRIGLWYHGVSYNCRSTRPLPDSTRVRIVATVSGNGVARSAGRTFFTPASAG